MSEWTEETDLKDDLVIACREALHSLGLHALGLGEECREDIAAARDRLRAVVAAAEGE